MSQKDADTANTVIVDPLKPTVIFQSPEDIIWKSY